MTRYSSEALDGPEQSNDPERVTTPGTVRATPVGTLDRPPKLARLCTIPATRHEVPIRSRVCLRGNTLQRIYKYAKERRGPHPFKPTARATRRPVVLCRLKFQGISLVRVK